MQLATCCCPCLLTSSETGGCCCWRSPSRGCSAFRSGGECGCPGHLLPCWWIFSFPCEGICFEVELRGGGRGGFFVGWFFCFWPVLGPDNRLLILIIGWPGLKRTVMIMEFQRPAMGFYFSTSSQSSLEMFCVPSASRHC